MGLWRRAPKQASAYDGSGGNKDLVGGLGRPDETWQATIRGYDDEGPGFIGFSLDLKALTASLCDLTVEERADDGTWAPTESDLMQQVGSLFVGVEESANDLLYAQVRGVSAVGEVFLETTDHLGEVAYRIVQSNQLGQKREIEGASFVVVRDSENAREGTDGDDWRLVPVQKLQRLHWADPKWPATAWSPLKRCIPDIERYLSIVRSMDAGHKSRLLNASMVWLAAEAAQAYARPTGPNQVGRNFHTDFSRHGRKALTKFSALEEYIPFSLSTPNEYGPPQVVEFGRDVTSEELAAEEQAVKAVARGLDLPQRVLTDGPGEGNHWSDWLLSADVIRTSVRPNVERQLTQLSAMQLRPLIATLVQLGRIPPTDPTMFRWGADFSEVTRNPDESETALRYYMAGILNRNAAGRRGMNLADDEFMDLEDPETDWWETHHGRGNSREFGAPEEVSPSPLGSRPGTRPTATGPAAQPQTTGQPPVLAGSAARSEWIEW